MRAARVRVAVAGRAADERLTLYGPDAAGALDDSVVLQTGDRPVHPDVVAPRWLESAWLVGPWLGVRRSAGWLTGAWLIDPWLSGEAPLTFVGSERHEHGTFEYGAAAVDDRGNASSGAPVAGSVLVASAPAPAIDASVAVAAGVVTMTIGQRGY